MIIYFKDGSKEIIADRYRIDGNRVIAVLTSGQETAIPLDAVDLEKTEEMGKVAKGSAMVIDRGERDARGPDSRLAAWPTSCASAPPCRLRFRWRRTPRARCATRPPATSTSSARRGASSRRPRAPS